VKITEFEIWQMWEPQSSAYFSATKTIHGTVCGVHSMVSECVKDVSVNSLSYDCQWVMSVTGH
jgi:hypothetical protein